MTNLVLTAARAAVLSAAAAALFPALSAGAERRVTVPISTAPGIEGGGSANLLHTSSDGSRVLFATTESLLPEDDDNGAADIYERRGATLELISRGSDSDPSAPRYKGASADGTRVWFEADEDLMGGGDGDFGNAPDLYERTGGTTRLLTKPVNPFGFSFSQPGPFIVASPDGAHVLVTTDEALVAGDSDGSDDVYDVGGNSPVLVSVGVGGEGAGALAISGDGARIFFTTTASIDAADTDSGAIDVYERSGGATTLRTPGTAEELNPRQVTADGDRVFFTTREQAVSADIDGTARDVYMAQGPTLSLVSTGTQDADDAIDADFQKASDDGSVAYFTTQATLETTDDDNGVQDIYRHDLGITTLASTGPNRTGQPDDFLVFSDISADGERMFWRTTEGFVDDTDGGFLDAYERDGTTTKRLSIGATNDQGFADSSFAGFATDGSTTFFQTDGDFVASDTDGKDDLYERTAGGVTDRLFAPTEECDLLPSSRCLPTWKGSSDDGVRAWVESDETLAGPDGDGNQTDIFESRLVKQPTTGGLGTTLELGEDDPAEDVLPDFTLADAYDDVFGAVIDVTGTGPGDDELGFTDLPGITGVVSDGGAKLTLSGRATEAEYQAAIRTVTYRNTSGAPAASRSVRVAIDEGGVLSDPVGRTVAVAAVNDAPAVAPGSGSAAYTENGAAVAVAPAGAVADQDNANLDSVSVIVGGCRRGVDLLTAAAPGLTVAYDEPTCALSVSGSATVAAYTAVLQSVSYRNASEDPVPGPRTLSFQASDGAELSTVGQRTLVVTPVNDAATAALSAGTASVPSGGAPVAVDPAAEVEDLDDSLLLGATVRVAAGAKADADELALASPPAGITVTSSGDGQQLTLSGLAPLSAYRSALRAVTFRDRSAAGEPGARTIEVRVDDGQGFGPAATRALEVAGKVEPKPTTPEPAAPAPTTPVATPPSVKAISTGVLALGKSPRISGRRLAVGCGVSPGAVRSCEVRLLRRGKVIATGALSVKTPAPSVLVDVRLTRAESRKLAKGAKRIAVELQATLTLADGATLAVNRSTRILSR